MCFRHLNSSFSSVIQIKGRVLGYSHADYADTMYHLGTVNSKFSCHPAYNLTSYTVLMC